MSDHLDASLNAVVPKLPNSEAAAHFSPWLTQLDRMREQLKQTAKSIEDSVVGVCDSFQSIAARARSTVARATSFLGRDEEADSGKQSFEALLHTCSDTLIQIMNTTVEAGEISRRAIERIEQMDQASQQISECLGQLDEIARGNRMLSFNARIEAAHAGNEGRGFAVVAVELATQTTKSMAVTAHVSGVVMNLRALADSTLKDLRRMNEQDSERVNQCRLQVDASLNDLQAAHSEMVEMLNGMTAEGTLIATDIGAAVRGLQFQDRTNQRILHVVEGLDQLYARLTAQMDHLGNVAPLNGTADEGFSAYTMQEERAVAGLTELEAPAGDVELF